MGVKFLYLLYCAYNGVGCIGVLYNFGYCINVNVWKSCVNFCIFFFFIASTDFINCLFSPNEMNEFHMDIQIRFSARLVQIG